MRRIRWPHVVVVVAVLALGTVTVGYVVRKVASLRQIPLPVPESVPSGDWEIAWINTPTSADAWDEFVTGVKRCEMQVPGLIVDASEAFPEHTTSVPQVVVSRHGHEGKLRVRWYKTGTGASTADWLEALASRDPAPVAVIGGWSSDRAIELAEHLNRQTTWYGDRPLLFITAATVDNVQTTSGSFGEPGHEPQLTDLYPERIFRFCFTNKQMAEAVTDYLTQDVTLWSAHGEGGNGHSWSAAIGGWPASLGWQITHDTGPAVFTLQWQDDPYSEDLADYFTEALDRRVPRTDKPNTANHRTRSPVFVQRNRIPFSTGTFSRPNPGETEAVHEIMRQLRPPGERSILIIPTVTTPMRRVLLSLSERIPDAGRRVVAITGDGLSVNALYRDVEYTWPTRSIPIPLVLFCHQNPFGWDEPNDPAPPKGYTLDPTSKRSTQDILLYSDIGLTLIHAFFPDVGTGVSGVNRADELAGRIHSRQPAAFDTRGNRIGGSGEHVVVMRPTGGNGMIPGSSMPDALIEVYLHRGDTGWSKVKSVEVRIDSRGEGRPQP